MEDSFLVICICPRKSNKLINYFICFQRFCVFLPPPSHFTYRLLLKISHTLNMRQSACEEIINVNKTYLHNR